MSLKRAPEPQLRGRSRMRYAAAMTVSAAEDIDEAIASFRTGAAAASGEGLAPRGWSAEHWRELFRFTELRRISATDALIRRGDSDRTLYFVLRGNLEVVIQSGDGISMGSLTRVGAGSVLGEQSFFDGNPRSASVWAVVESEVAAMTPEQYAAFAAANPERAPELLFALGRVLAVRLRQTTAKVLG
jgi:signal-transduction protein with cAMP-binding, CBS, and nucleotidyltransferase domain